MFKVPRIDCDILSAEALDRAFGRTERQAIACNNWSDDYPYAPEVGFRMFHTGDRLAIRYDVREEHTAARAAADHGTVWCDSCVEFFFAPDEEGYYNFETNCIGTLHLGYNRRDHAPAEVLESVGRMPSLPRMPFAEVTGDNRWTMTVLIPASALFRHSIPTWSGLRGTMNLYKCGDHLSRPHFLSWRPIEAPKPQFHLPGFFGEVAFE